jgi:adenine-specific DNA-methyltransferase
MSKNNEKSSYEDLILEIEKLKQENDQLKKRKKYGLVWEDKPEKFEKESQNALPVLKEKGEKFKDIIDSKNPKGDFNILIEGDNYHSLSVLNYTHRKKIDVIYIDPPYNTGNKDFIYNDYFVDKEDRFRHSKWLSFMAKRLKLAKNLLKDNGAIFISIDDHEFSQLKLLCDEIFGEKNFAGEFIWQKQGNDNKSIFSGTNTFRNDHEFIIVYTRDNRSVKFNRIEENAIFQNNYGNADDDPRGNWMSAELGKSDKRSLPHGKNYFTLKSPTGVKWTRQWHYNKNEIKELIKDNRIYFGKNKDSVPRLKKFLSDKVHKVPSSLLLKQGSTKIGIDEIRNIFNKQRPFDYPKPIKLIKYFLQLHFKKSSTVLDFMAGSGTTGHAVLDLNKEDGGNRKFILCTNNENKICEDVTWQRIKKVSQGYTKPNGEKVEGLGGNIKYLKTDFIKINDTADNLKEKVVETSTEILCLKENTFSKVKDSYNKNQIKIFENNDKYTAILFDLFYFDEFIEELKKLKDKPVAVYVFSYTKDFSKKEFADLEIDFSVEAIPEKVLETYKKIFNF